MQAIYYAIVLIVLYGDLVKRVLPPSVALFALYTAALAVLVVIAIRKQSLAPRMKREGHVLHVAVMLLILLYLLQLATSPLDYFMEAVSHAMYMIIPFMYILVLQRRSQEFDLVNFGKVFLLLMIPINLVGLVQFFHDPTFLITTAYDKDLGGIIERNFLDLGSFNRYPSLFTSADRYSAMGLMQLYFTVIVFGMQGNISRKSLWLSINLASAVVALLVAGARSRILIAISVTALSTLTYFLKSYFSRKSTLPHTIILLTLILSLGVLTISLQVLYDSFWKETEVDIFPVITMLSQTFKEGDIGIRLGEAAELSILPQEITVFGQGLGTIAEGKPGEFGIRSVWIESGILWGIPMLSAFLAIVVALFLMAWQSFRNLDALNVAIYTVPLLLFIFALLAGLTSSFELSTGLMLGCSIAVITQNRRDKRTGIKKLHSTKGLTC